MANIVTSFVSELLPKWMERKARREKAQSLQPQGKPQQLAEQAPRLRPPAQQVHRPKAPPPHWRASSM